MPVHFATASPQQTGLFSHGNLTELLMLSWKAAADEGVPECALMHVGTTLLHGLLCHALDATYSQTLFDHYMRGPVIQT